MPRMRGIPEKSRDFKGSIKRLFKNLKTWHFMLIFALVLAMLSAILSLIGPNKLSDLADTITLGLQPNLTEESINKVMTSEDITTEEKLEFSKLLEEAKNETDTDKLLNAFDSLPKNIYKIVKPKIDMKKVKLLDIEIRYW